MPIASESLAIRGSPAFRWRCRDPRLAPHQRAAATRLFAILDRHTLALLADEPGLGKSWTATAVGVEMRRRGFQVEIFAPAMLVPMWRALSTSFELDAVVRSHDALRRLPPSRDPAASGLVIVDEAHHFCNPATLRYAALARAVIGGRVLLVTATPLCNRLGDLHALLALGLGDTALAADGVASLESVFESAEPQAITLALDSVCVRRGREVLTGLLSIPGLDRTRIAVAPGRGFDEALRCIGALEFPSIARNDPERRLLYRILQRRLESSAEAAIESLRRLRSFTERALDAARRGLHLGRKEFRRIFGDELDAPVQELLFPELWLPPVLEDGTGALRDEITRIDTAIRSVRGWCDEKPALLEETLAAVHADGVIVFTTAVATARGITARLETRFRVGLLSARRCRIDRAVARGPHEVLEAMRMRRIDVLVSTDLAGEGLNLQCAGTVIHYDLPWNPVRIEQRNGRVRRIGQARERVRALYFLPRPERDPVALLAILSGKAHLARAILEPRVSPLEIDPRDEAALRDGPDTLASSSPEECGALEKRAAAWSAIPARLDRSSPQRRLTQVLEAAHLLSSTLGALLSKRYRVGVERMLGELATGRPDMHTVEQVERMLEREVSMEGLWAE